MKIVVNGKHEMIDTKPLTLLCHKGDMSIKVPGRLEIGSPETLLKAWSLTQEELTHLTQIGGGLFDVVFKTSQVRMPKLVDELLDATVGVQHVVGMIALIFEGFITGRELFFRQPETHLHPEQQLGLGDLLIRLTLGG